MRKTSTLVRRCAGAVIVPGLITASAVFHDMAIDDVTSRMGNADLQYVPHGTGMTDVLEGILGYDAERMGELLVAGSLE